MTNPTRHLIAFVMIVFLTVAPCRAMADAQEEFKDPQVNAAYIIGDAVIARPVGLVMTVAGFGLFLVASPFALISRSAGDTWDGLVVYPAKFTFTRPMGQFD